MIVRESCSICGSSRKKLLAKMTKEYLMTGDNGWRHDPVLMKYAGFDYEKDPDQGCSYYECLKCGTFYLKELYPIEEAFGLCHAMDKSKREKYYTRSSTPSVIYGNMQRASINRSLISLALKQKPESVLKVLDYGCGGGKDLSIFKSFGIDNLFGYNHVDFPFDLIKKYYQKGITLINEIEELNSNGPFDVIKCNSVLEHVYNPGEVIEHIYSLLSPNGYCYFYAPSVSRNTFKKYIELVKENTKVKNLHQGHVQIWNTDALPLSRFVQSKGFKIIPVNVEFNFDDISQTKGLMKYLGKICLHGIFIFRAVFLEK